MNFWLISPNQNDAPTANNNKQQNKTTKYKKERAVCDEIPNGDGSGESA